jgi:signal transduction histidine kinase/ActR/RegA family two-component response regulator
MCIASLSLAGYVFGADPLYSIPRLTTIAVQTSSILLAVGIGLIAAVPERQPMRGLLEDSAAGVLTRRILPFIVFIPLILGRLRVWGQDAGLYDTAMGTALLVLGLVVFLCGLLWWSAGSVRGHERATSALNARLRTSIRELEAVFSAAPVGIAVSRDRDCRDVTVNAAFARLLGIDERTNASRTGPSAEELPFRFLDQRGDEIPGPDLPLQVAARDGKAVVGRTLVLVRADGERLILVGSAVPVDHAKGEAEGAIAVFVNTTAEHRASAEREALLSMAEQARAEAETANRAKDEFLAVLSHELRSPLNAMLGWVRILQEAAAGNAMVDRAVETLERNIWAQTKVINDLLDISRITSGKFQLERARVDLAALIAGIVDSLRPMAAGKRLTLDVTVPPQRLDVDGDAGRLEQVVGNVLHNAIKFTPDGGRIALRLRDGGGRAELEIADDGQGIEAELLPRVFDRFVQSEGSTTRRHGGLGLGLAIVKHLALLHGGTVRAESEGRGRGARFTIGLPLASAAPGKSADGPPVSAAGHDTRLSSLDVLLVDDDADSREALGLSIGQSGARVRVVASVREALGAYDASVPDLLLSDIGMPEEDGYALIRAIREREDGTGRRTVAIAMTGFASRQDYEAALRAGFDEHVAKPVDPTALLERIRVLTAAREA